MVFMKNVLHPLVTPSVERLDWNVNVLVEEIWILVFVDRVHITESFR